MPATVRLPDVNGNVSEYTLSGSTTDVSKPTGPFRERVAYAAAHVVPKPLEAAGGRYPIDWEATLAYREHLWSYGLGVAEAMDTAQRGMGLGYSDTKELITRSCGMANAAGALVACGAGTDQLADGVAYDLAAITAAYEEQCAHIEAAGGRIILMASRQLAAAARNYADYLQVYSRILEQVKEPVILHWLGDMFDPALRGYWGSTDVQAAMRSCVDLIGRHREKVAGVKLSLLNADYERELRSALPEGVRMLTGDDFNYPELILGDETGTSDALLGIFDVIAPQASGALQALDAGDVARYRELFDPTVPLSRKIFETPTFYYKAGVVFVAYLNGFQDHFRMVAGLENTRSIVHYAELFRLADGAGVLTDPDRAATRMRPLLELSGVAQ